jgi:hypothetical protein
VEVDESRAVASVDVYYTQQGQIDGLKDDRINTMNRFWHHAPAQKSDAGWATALPLWSVDRPLWVFADVSYKLDQPQTGAGYYYRTYTADRVNLASRMEMVRPEQLKEAGVKIKDGRRVFIETFEGDWEKEWYSYRVDGWEYRTHKVSADPWKAPEGAKLVMEVRSEQPNKLVVGLDGFGAVVELKGGSEWRKVTLSVSDFQNAEEKPLAGWEGIRELRLVGTENLVAGRGSKKTVLTIGGAWKGADPAFRGLRWE